MLLLLLVVALVSAAESAFFSLSPTDMEELKTSDEKTDERILSLIEGPKRLLATLLISVNFINIAIVILSSFIIEELFDFSNDPLLGFITQVVVVTFLILLIGEVTPKIYATQNPLRVSRTLVILVQVLQRIFYPVSSFLIFTTSVLDKIIKPRAHNISVDELSQALELTVDEDIPAEDHKILKGIVKFGHTDVKQIMRSRMDVIAFESELGFTKLLDAITNSGFSRVPIYKGALDNVLGVLYSKDLLQYMDEKDDFNWHSIIRPPFFVPENKKIDDLLREFQTKKIHLAVVVDEYGGTSGIVTLEDVIEEIVGEINDEFDDDDLIYSKLDDNNYVFEGKAHLNDVYRVLQIDGEDFEDAKGEADTLAGLILEVEGRIPTKNEKIQFKNLSFTIEAADNRRIKRVKVTIDRMTNE
ncbi:MAG TPA: gliding motility-associated protein GldE [Bacteroidia bacterium]|jgi:gliding motility-associated protein GldE|nr:gliding motility-associated protein GldE [Bacteroidia bacterium]HRG51306.1 gliding motility-associated protein GldE [Bacteroidia bacterium]